MIRSAAAKKAFSIPRTSSGSLEPVWLVYPERSANSTVTGRRSPSPAGAAMALVPTGLPHPPQKRSAGALAKPQVGQRNTSGPPHVEQKRREGSLSALQAGQRIGRVRER